MTWALNVLIAFDQFLNAVFFGQPDETLSSRAYRMKMKKQPYWFWVADFIDVVLWFDPYHCEMSYLSEVYGRQNAAIIRKVFKEDLWAR